MKPFETFRARSVLLGLIGFTLLSIVPLAYAREHMLVIMNAVYLIFLGYAVWLARRHGIEIRRLMGPRVSPGEAARVLAVVPALTALNAGSTWLVFYPLSLVSPDLVRSWLESMDKAMPDAVGVGGWIVLLVSVVVVAPVVEEFVFRGLLLHRWSRKWGVLRGVLASTAAFAVLHFSPLGIFLLGLGIAAIYLRTGSLWLAIIAHGLNNLLAFTVLPLFMPQWDSGTDLLTGFQRSLPGGLIALALGLAGAVLLRREYWPSQDTPLPYQRNQAEHDMIPEVIPDERRPV